MIFFAKHESDCKENPGRFLYKTTHAEWENFSQVKKTFHSADNVGNTRIVFNIKGNQYKLVVLVLFRNQMAHIRFVGTHDVYDIINDIENI